MNIIEQIVSFLAPHECIVCKKEGLILCDYCRADSLLEIPSRCAGCHKTSVQNKTCVKCRPVLRAEHVFVGYAYSGVAETIIAQTKFAHKRQGARVIAKAMAERLPYLPQDTIIVAVPTAPTRVRERGFDQSTLIARQLAKDLRLKNYNHLCRTTNTRQLGNTRKKRFEQMEQGFFAININKIKEKNVLLVDDVFTTGATIAGATKVLKQAGAKSVMAAIFAQKV